MLEGGLEGGLEGVLEGGLESGLEGVLEGGLEGGLEGMRGSVVGLRAGKKRYTCKFLKVPKAVGKGPVVK